MPFMTWPDGSPCLQANAYMVKARTFPGRGGYGPSRLGTKGGTLGDYAGKISHLIRFCYYNKLNFISLSDDDFCKFIDGLRAQKKADNPAQPKRTERTINSIAKRCLSFLTYVGEMHGMHNFVGEGGTISVTTVHKIVQRNGKPFHRSSVHHRSFRRPSAKRTRNPIGEATIEKLRDAVDEMSTSDFLCNRRQLMISLFEELGARRIEIHAIKVNQIYAASKTLKPIISVMTVKRGNTEMTRELELSRPMIDQLMDYIREDRFPLMKRFKGVPDHGFLFVTERGGRPLGIDSITTEFSNIRRAAGIEEQACAHLFRHSFCTNVVAELIAGIEAISPDSFRQTIMTNKMIAQHAMAKTGHSTLESLLDYVDNAYKSKSKYELILKHIDAANVIEIYEKRRRRLVEDFEKDKITKAEFLAREKALSESRSREISAA